MDAKKWFFLNSGANYGLLSTLIAESGNGGTTLKARTIFNGITSGGKYQGTWASGTTYSAYDIVGYPSDALPIRYRAKQSPDTPTAGQSPDTHPTKWDLASGVEFLQDLGLGTYARYSLGVRNDAMIRLNGLEIGTYTTSSFSRRESNYVGQGATTTIGTSATTFAVPGSHPSSRTLTTGAGLASSLPDSETLSGTCTDTFTIPTTTPTFLTLTLPTGLTLTEGETITLYGNASNFVVVVVARYNSSTGAFYGGSTNSVGSGSFSSWTIKRERLIYIYDTTDTTGKNFYCLVQTYDNVTGSLVVNSVANVSTTSNSDWTISRAKTPNNPTASTATFFNNNISTAYAVGHWMLGSFTGDRLSMKSNKDSNGMDWVFVYLRGDETTIPADVTVSTYNATLLTTQETTVFTGLTKGTHYFMAMSKAAASGTNLRAYITSDTDAGLMSFNEKYEYDIFTPMVTAGPRGGESFGEIAYSFRDSDGADTPQWLPEHSNVLTTYLTSKSLTINGTSIDLSSENNPYALKFVDISNTSTLLQTLDVQHPQASGSMGTLSVTHTFDRNGLYYKIIQTWAQAGLIATGYNNMVFLGDAWFSKVLCEDNQVITRPADNTSVNLTASQESQRSYLFYSTEADPLNDYVLALAFPNPTRDWRVGGANRGTPFIQSFSAGAGNAKFYPHVYNSYSFAASEVMTVEGRIYLGNKGSLVLS